MKCLGRDAPTLSSFFETPEVKNEISEALLMSQMKRSSGLEMKFSITKVDFSMEKFQIPEKSISDAKWRFVHVPERAHTYKKQSFVLIKLIRIIL